MGKIELNQKEIADISEYIGQSESIVEESLNCLWTVVEEFPNVFSEDAFDSVEKITEEFKQNWYFYPSYRDLIKNEMNFEEAYSYFDRLPDEAIECWQKQYTGKPHRYIFDSIINKINGVLDMEDCVEVYEIAVAFATIFSGIGYSVFHLEDMYVKRYPNGKKDKKRDLLNYTFVSEKTGKSFDLLGNDSPMSIPFASLEEEKD